MKSVKITRQTTWVTLLITTVLCSTPALAQNNDDFAPSLEEIIVTARKKPESLQDAPVAVTALSGADLEVRGAVNISDATAGMPNVIFESAGTNSGLSAAPTVFIRGIGQADFVINTDPGVGTYVDGVYMGRSIGSLADLLDLEQVEVLRGPQGTLFGRNTIGGAVNLVSVAPTPDSLSGKVGFAGGSRTFLNGTASLNIPVGDKAAVRIAGFGRHRDGFVDAIQYDDFKLGEENVYGGRIAVRFLATDNFTIDVAGDYSVRRDSPAPIVARLIGNASVGGDAIDASGIPVASRFNVGVPSPPPIPAGFGRAAGAVCNTAQARNSSPDCFGNFYVSSDDFESNAVYTDVNGMPIEAEQALDVFGISGTLTWETVIGTLKSITAYRGFDSEFFNDVDFTPFVLFHNLNLPFNQDQFSQEFQLSGTNLFDGRLDYVVGLYHFEEDGIQTISLLSPLSPPAAAQTTLPLFQETDREIDNKSQAIYGQATFNVTEQLHITGGIRYTNETKDIFFEQRRSVGATLTNAEGSIEIDDVSFMANIAYDVTDDILAYATFSEGFRSGGFASRFPTGLVSPLPSFEPEFVTSYEIGFKSSLFNNRLRANFAAFLTDYKDLQVTAGSPELGGSILTQNLADAKLQGIELEIDFAATENLTIDFSIGLLDDEIEEVIGGSLTAGATNQLFTITTDNELPYTPGVTTSLGFTHFLPVSFGDFRTRFDWFYVSSQQLSLENHPLTEQDGYSRVNLNIAFTPNNSDFTFTVGARNLTNSVFSTAAAINTTAATVGANVSRPREVFGQITYRFGK